MCDKCFQQVYLGQFLKDKKAKTVLNGFIEIVNKSKRKTNKLWTDQGKEFYYSRT